MAEINQFGSVKPGTPEVCAHCEAVLMDVLDRTATPADQAFFDRHLATCTSCSRMFIDAKRGGAWLEMLRDPRPEPAANLFERIISQTSGSQTSGSQANAAETQAANLDGADLLASLQAVSPTAMPSPQGNYLYGAPGMRPTNFSGAKVLPFRVRSAVHSIRQTMLQPRLAMTAAMAFFSIALTLNLTGIHVTELRAADLKPSSIRKGLFEANAHVVRYCDNLRVVYELEARAHDLQRSSDDTPTTPDAAPVTKAPEKPEPKADPAATPHKTGKPGPGTSQAEPLARRLRMVAVAARPEDLPATHSLVHPTGAVMAGGHTKGDLA